MENKIAFGSFDDLRLYEVHEGLYFFFLISIDFYLSRLLHISIL